ncbi:hypothetical protein Bca101_029356 [Brassica carinata]
MWYWSMRRNILKEGRLSDLSLCDVLATHNLYGPLFVGRGVLLCRKIVQLLALLLELDHFAPLKADAGLTTVRQHGGVKKIESIPLSELNPYVLSSLPRLDTLQRRHTMVEL